MNNKPANPEPTYMVEQGIKSPRDGSINWQAFEAFDSLAAAKRELRKTDYRRGYWRIVACRIVFEKTDNVEGV